jgi:YD repeat-containing protein
MIISGGYSGGYNANSGSTVNTPGVQQTGNSQSTAVTQTPIANAPISQPTADPIDTADGTYQVQNTDLALGQAEPRGITLSRYYNGTRRFINPAGMSGGWIHNYIVNANPAVAPQASLGDTTPQQMAPMLVASAASIATYYYYNIDPKNWMVGALIAKWGIDQITYGGVSVNLGKDTLQFVEQPTGVFTSPADCTATLTQNGSSYSLQMRHGNKFNFDSLGRLTNIVDQYSQPLNVAYLSSTSSLPQKVTDWKGRTLTFAYTGNQLTSVADSAGRSISYGYSTAYNPQGDLTSFTDPESKNCNYAYDTNHDIIASFDANNQMVVSNLFDVLGHVTTQYVEGNLSKMWQIFWSGWDTVEYDPSTNVSFYEYDDQGRLIAMADPMQQYNEMLYDGQNHVVDTVSPLYEIGQFFYDGNNNLIETIDQLGYTNQYIYDTNNNLVETIDPRGNISKFGYNSEFSLTGQTNGAGNWVNFVYSTSGALAGTLTSRTDPGGTMTYGYDSTYGQLTNITYPNGLGSEGFVNSSLGDVTSHTDGRGFATAFSYNNRRQLTNSIEPTNLVTTTTYDAVGNIASSIDARGNITSETWSPVRNLTSTTLPAMSAGTPVSTNLYDIHDWLIGTVDPLQNFTSYGNNPDGLVISQTDPQLRTTTLGYDADSRKIATTNAASETTYLLPI